MPNEYGILRKVIIVARVNVTLRHMTCSVAHHAACGVHCVSMYVCMQDKWRIGIGIVRPLLQRMVTKLESAMSSNCPSRVTLFFSSESHIHALRNVLLLSGIASNRTVATTLVGCSVRVASSPYFSVRRTQPIS